MNNNRTDTGKQAAPSICDAQAQCAIRGIMRVLDTPMEEIRELAARILSEFD